MKVLVLKTAEGKPNLIINRAHIRFIGIRENRLSEGGKDENFEVVLYLSQGDPENLVLSTMKTKEAAWDYMTHFENQIKAAHK